ncbi:glutamate 5-kinase [Shewanella algae]|uniref:glutamate 5-kinase n=1 Tax=Shewanella algae TaxID=38313 RepID=UPI001183E73D|nr:glutamate 5-kinase [Shewanella algae]MBO2644036.1 glutamate 5-kinase [Shewanella algae]MBO2656771.1 glutamate 5-kinase [Shewanella algae]TVO84250.1 glutamate 5-kinase [Shewanella algae]TVO88582.1 glutamate 5-kinase [Shewanella algae]TVO93135.1 glutamate 5-kinase [Shewanella algae]
MNKQPRQRIVLKVGSALIAPDRQGCSSRYLLAIAQFIVRCRAKGIQTILVSSGSIAAGAHRFPLKPGCEANSPEAQVVLKKAMAAAGQTEMMATWDKFFDFPTAQILLTHGDLRDRERYLSIRETVFTLLDHDILPILNENDTVTTDALKVGDNDNLSAMVAAAADADTLVICSDIDGLYNKNPHLHSDAELLPEVNKIDAAIYAMAGGSHSDVGTGGMRTKIEAAEKASSHGIDTYIVNGFKEESFNALLSGRNPGTLFRASETPLQERMHWLTHTVRAQGEVIVAADEEMDSAKDCAELSSNEVLEVKGNFAAGDTILLRSDDGTRLAKARSNYSSSLLSFIAEQEDPELADSFTDSLGGIVSEKDIALLSKTPQLEK